MVALFNPNVFFTVAMLNGYEASVLCPFHQDSDPSASFNIKTGLFHCFACNFGLTIKQLCRELNVSKAEAYLKPDQRITFILPIKELNDSSIQWIDYIKSPLAFNNRYLAFRGVSNEFVEKYKIRYSNNCIVFPQVKPNGQEEGVQIRKLEGHPKYKFIGKRTAVWPMIDIKTIDINKPVYLTEGNFGALRAISSGLQAFSTQSAGGIERAISVLMGLDIVVVFDSDTAGTIGMIKGLFSGWRVAYPTFEADEAFVSEWKNFDLNLDKMTTRNISKLKDKLNDPKKITRILRHHQLGYAANG
jgi:hypothetical protein